MRLREREGVYSAIWPISLHSIYCLQLAERFSLYRERRARDSHSDSGHTHRNLYYPLPEHNTRSVRQVRHAHAEAPAPAARGIRPTNSAIPWPQGLAAEALGKLQQCLVEMELLRLRPAEG